MTPTTTCARCDHSLADHSPNTGMCTWQAAGLACKCLGPEQAERIKTWAAARADLTDKTDRNR